MTDTVSGLLPCPFCGGEAEFVEGADDGGQWVAIGCPDCGAGSRQHYAVMEDPRPHAQSAWNTRASQAAQPPAPNDDLRAENERLREALERALALGADYAADFAGCADEARILTEVGKIRRIAALKENRRG